MPSLPDSVHRLIDAALEEDLGDVGDVTCAYFVPESSRSEGSINARAHGTVAGVEVAEAVFHKVDPDVALKTRKRSGDRLTQGDIVMEISGATRSILTAERTALNFLQRMSGVATLTRAFVDKVGDHKARILDTRKTLPGWRVLDKAAVVAGGGKNHRMGLYDMAMVKDNHLLAGGRLSLKDLQESIRRIRNERPGVKIELEADRMSQVEDFLALDGVDVIMLDNMAPVELRDAVNKNASLRNGVRLEASGGVNLDTVADIAATGVDFISVGALTHSAVALDLALDLDES